ncbi:MAG: hypothetical protein GTO67_03395 [Gammaproteobacteria bacterium]|nr:hypothetical protein [Gammaproteobacteria bacterium]NIN37773.1 hypothetical protein [Gammaproteobacteria bacterium]NIO23433.1 hypothetical protein [Gammaproteobacteria bacterium]NIO64049.1 hypothetical protein [Gammaproteobacteria bacterium]NIP47089.1 hypothetical protein [Gammaproteobacteria bacterium]
MSDSPHLEIIYKDLQNEHHRVMKLVDRLRALDTSSDLISLLDQLRTLLIVHFAREQLPDGFYEALGERADDRRDEIQTLVEDHGAILSSINTLIEDAKASDAGSEGDMLARVSRLVEQLHDHELREHHFADDVMGRGAASGG